MRLSNAADIEEKYPIKLAPIELSIMREIENKPGPTAEHILSSLEYVVKDVSYIKSVIRQLKIKGFVREKEGRFFKAI